MKTSSSSVSLFILLLLLCGAVHAQVSGIVLSAKSNKELGDVTVFVNRTTVTTTTDKSGNFSLSNVPAGFIELVLFSKGYALYRSTMKIQPGRSYKLNLSLEPRAKVKKASLTSDQLTKLKEMIAPTPDSLEVNTGELVVSEDQKITTPSTPTTVVNKKLGYSVSIFFSDTPLASIQDAPVLYTSLPFSDMKESVRAETNRMYSFKGSPRHWLMAVIAGATTTEGFEMRTNDGKPIEAASLVTPSSQPGYFKIQIPGAIKVEYTSKSGRHTTMTLSADGAVDANAVGAMINPRQLKIEGVRTAAASTLPIDYIPINGDPEEVFAESGRRLYEKVYVHTDKPFYYAGEALWMKAYINFYYPQWRDSLSQVLYAELISPERKIIMTKNLKIDSGFTYANIVLSDTLKPGTYYLRAYTNLSRNFGDDQHFIKPIPILDINSKVDRIITAPLTTEPSVSFTTNKKQYLTREKIELTIKTSDNSGNPTGSNLSISVTDATQVPAVPEWKKITDVFPIGKNEVKTISSVTYPPEYGINMRGQFLNDRGKPEKSKLNFLQLVPRTVFTAEADQSGMFQLTELQLMDTTTLLFKSEKAQSTPYGTVKILPHDTPPLDFKAPEYTLHFEKTESAQRVISEYEVPKDVTLLGGVEIRAKRLDNDINTDRSKRPYGNADMVVSGKQIKEQYPNILYSLVGLPGLDVNPIEGTIVVTRARNTSVQNSGPPMIMLNNVALGGDPGVTLSNISPSSVQSIEITKRYNVLYGSAGANGVISIYTKEGVSTSVLPQNFKKVSIQGFARYHSFRFPNYDEANTDATASDYRSILFWKPDVNTNSKTGAATVSFFASDLPGNYRVVVEGVKQSGEPFHAEYTIEVNGR